MSELLLNAANEYRKLLAVEYDIVVAHKGTARYICLSFGKEHFYHLCGLQYAYGATSVRTVRKESALELVLSNDIDDNLIFGTNSKVDANRILCVKNLQYILDQNNLYFLWDYRKKPHSQIKAEYLLSSSFTSLPCYIFIDHGSNNHYCKSIFPSSQDVNGEYIKGLTKFSLLYKRKRVLDTGECQLQFNRNLLDKHQMDELGIP